ncbi:hypothetical protein GBA52_026506 [Prunus armeniaca]|nr:hypothetical protein GBA52_026506 [Prunus armeniaca]
MVAMRCKLCLAPSMANSSRRRRPNPDLAFVFLEKRRIEMCGFTTFKNHFVKFLPSLPIPILELGQVFSIMAN